MECNHSLVKLIEILTHNMSSSCVYSAIKSNPDEQVILLLSRLGCGFDCASQHELSTILRLAPNTNRVDDIIYANPTKQTSMLHYARDQKIPKMTFDNVEELQKIASVYPEAECVLRILVDDSKSICRFGAKFGTHKKDIRPVLQKAADLKLNVVGIR